MLDKSLLLVVMGLQLEFVAAVLDLIEVSEEGNEAGPVGAEILHQKVDLFHSQDENDRLENSSQNSSGFVVLDCHLDFQVLVQKLVGLQSLLYFYLEDVLRVFC